MKRLILIISSLFLVWSCQDLNSIQSPDEFNLNNHFGQYVDTTFSADAAEFQVDYLTDTGNASKLSIGSVENFEARFLLKFTDLPEETILVDSIYLEMISYQTFGDVQGDLQISVFEVDQSWDESANTLQEWHDYEPTTLIGNYSFPLADTLKFEMELDSVLINKWRSDADNNNGLMFKLQDNGAGYMRELKSFESPDPLLWPRLTYKTTVDTVVGEDSTNVGFDATIFDYNAPDGQNVFEQAKINEDILLSSGIASRAFIDFGTALAELPKTAVMHSANVLLEINDTDILTNTESNSLDNPNHSEDYYLIPITEISEDLSTFELDSSFVTSNNFLFFMSKSDSLIKLTAESEEQKFGKNMIQNFLNGTETSGWFYLQYANENQDLSVKRLYGIQEKDIKIRLRYFEVDETGL